jgi:flagellar biosynthesis GTPase FlhF
MSLIAKTQFMLEKIFNSVARLVPSASGKILYNKWVLYFIFIVGIYDVVHFYQRGNIMAVAIFFIVGFLTSFFSKNMIVVIVSAIAVSHIVAYGNKMTEGFEEEEEEEKEAFEKEEEEKEGFDEEEEEEEKKEEKKEEEKEEEKETFKESAKSKSSSNDLINDMNNLLKRTEKLIETSNQQGFSGMNNHYATYK